MKKKFPYPLWLIVACAVALVASFFASFVWFPDGLHYVRETELDAAARVTEIAPVTSVMISEVMTSNKTAWTDDLGFHSDWVELYNAGGAPADVTGWTLTDNARSAKMFKFPAYTIAPGECVLVYCTGVLINEPGNAFHAPFKLNAQREALLLYDDSGSIMESMNIPALSPDTSYARENTTGAFVATDDWTPGLPNTAANHEKLVAPALASDAPVQITEIVADNTLLADPDGDYPDYIELYNRGAQAVNLNGYCLSDDADNLYRWRFPDMAIEPGAYMVVFASGKNKLYNGYAHTNFKLNAEGETVTLIDPDGRIVTQVTYPLLGENQAYAWDATGTWRTVGTATPGANNAG